MSSRKGSKGKGSSLRESYPSDWSDWEWSAQYERNMRYRLRGPNQYEYMFAEPVVSAATTPRETLSPVTEYKSNDYVYTTSSEAQSILTGLGSLSVTPQTASYDVSQLDPSRYIPHLIRPLLDKAGYTVVDKPSRFFVVGRVFMTLWTQPAGENITNVDDPSYSRTIFGQLSFSKIRRFVVIRKRLHSSLCLPISTYGGRGSEKKDVRSEDQAVVYQSGSMPEYRQPEGFIFEPFPVVIEEAGQQIDPQSCLDFGHVYTVEHNIRVLNVGRVDAQHLARLKLCFEQAMSFAESDSDSFVELETPGEASQFSMTKGSYSKQKEKMRKDQYLSNESTSVAIPYAAKNRKSQNSQNIDESLRSFKVHHAKVFIPGKVLKVLWSEPAGSGGTAILPDDAASSPSHLGHKTYNSIRRFIILEAYSGHSICLPILTYGGRGTLKPGVVANHHAIIYTGRPEPFPGESLTKVPIEMVPDSPRQKLESASRINYAKIYTVEHNVKVQFIGSIAKSSQTQFREDFESVWKEGKTIQNSAYSVSRPQGTDSQWVYPSISSGIAVGGMPGYAAESVSYSGQGAAVSSPGYASTEYVYDEDLFRRD